MQQLIQRTLLLMYMVLPTAARAQSDITIQIPLPDAAIYANHLTKGDGDIYGLGDWFAHFTLSIDSHVLVVRGSVIFAEKTNDYTTISGTYEQRIEVEALRHCRFCAPELVENTGFVGGPNVGARGYRWYSGKGLVKNAYIVTDTFGTDVGRIGGTVRFAPVSIRLFCALAVRPSEPRSASYQTASGRTYSTNFPTF
jgi:hypothetical protein